MGFLLLPIRIVLVLMLTAATVQVINCELLQKNETTSNEFYKSMHDLNLYSKELLHETAGLDLSKQCFQDMITVYMSITQIWAFKIIDSSAKSLPSGVLEGNFVDFGNYDECINARNEENTINGKYYVVIIVIMPETESKLSFPRGICVPHTCSSKDVQLSINNILRELGLNHLFGVGIISGSTLDSYNYRTSDWITISVLVVIFIWLLICTALDVLKPDITSKHFVFRAFSIYYNGGKLFKLSTPSANSKTVTCLNGLRVLSILWIIMDHRFFFNYMFPYNINNAEDRDYLKSLPATYIAGGTVSVDTFFIMSGFLLTLTFLKQLDRLKGKIPWVMFYVHRYVRLTVGLLCVLIFALTIASKMGRGPLWNSVLEQGVYNSCEKYWWSTLLYVQNYVNPGGICLGHTWYLSVDMQLYAISPLILIPMWRWKKYAYIFISILLVILHISTYLIVYYKKLAVKYLTFENSQESIKDWNQYYYQPAHTRAITWLMGVLLGYHIYISRSPKRLNKIFVTFMWILSLSLLVAVVMTVCPFIQDDHELDRVWDTIYIVFSRPLWSLGVCWLIYACYYGYGGPIDWFLSLKMWTPLCRISYSVYLIHLIFQVMRVGATRTTKFFSVFNTLNEVISDVTVTVFLATCMYLFIECPIFNLEMWLFKRSTKNNTTTGVENTGGMTSSTQALA